MKINFKKNGPLVINFNRLRKVKIKKGEIVEEKEFNLFSLCRCGHSKNKPFCDGSHKETGFVGDEGEIEILE
ncbi:MAG: CDGSH iron-sulfur domain-containing protein [Candidatus Hydrothermales bacterium]